MPEVLTQEEKKITKPVNPKQQEWFNHSKVHWFDDAGKIRVPKDYRDNLEFRIWLSDLTIKGVDDDHLIKASLIKRCKEDYLFFFNAFLWTQDTRKSPSNLPFITYDYEDVYINWVFDHIKAGKDGLTEKSRDMGISWSVMGVFFYCWLFWEGFLAHIGSKKEDDVDRSGDIRSLFEKLRYLLNKIPPWLKPYQFDDKKHNMFMRLINPYNGNAITGESSNKDFGRAGRYRVLLLDEFASMEYDNEAWTATGDSSPCRLPVSTHKGTGTKFWQLRFKSNIDIFPTIHWTLHPEKSKDSYSVKDKKKLTPNEAYELWKKGEEVSSPWYEAEKNRRLTQEKQSKIDIAQELDCDPIASGDPYFDIAALKKQKEWELTEDWLNFNEAKQKVIIGILTEIDGKLEFRPNKNGWLRLFEKPKPGGQYVAGGDPSEGLTHGDNAVCAFRDKKTRNLTAGICGSFDYDELAYNSYLTARYFNNCLICGEAGGYGAAFNKRLYDLGANVARAVDLSTGNVEEKEKLGFINSSVSRPLMLGDLEAEIREMACELRDKDLIGECMNFINKNGKPQASEGSTDDYIFAYAIAGQLLRFRPYSPDLEKEHKNKNRFTGVVPKKNMGISFAKK